MTLKNTLSSLTAHFKYYAAIALAEEGPQQKVRAELMKEGWRYKLTEMSEEEAKNMMAMCAFGAPVTCIPPNKIKTFSPEGQEVFTKDGDKALEQRYKQAVRQAAARVYGIN